MRNQLRPLFDRVVIKELDPVPNWNDPDWQERIDVDELNQREKIIKNLKARFK